MDLVLHILLFTSSISFIASASPIATQVADESITVTTTSQTTNTATITATASIATLAARYDSLSAYPKLGDLVSILAGYQQQAAAAVAPEATSSPAEGVSWAYPTPDSQDVAEEASPPSNENKVPFYNDPTPESIAPQRFATPPLQSLPSAFSNADPGAPGGLAYVPPPAGDVGRRTV